MRTTLSEVEAVQEVVSVANELKPSQPWMVVVFEKEGPGKPIHAKLIRNKLPVDDLPICGKMLREIFAGEIDADIPEALPVAPDFMKGVSKQVPQNEEAVDAAVPLNPVEVMENEGGPPVEYKSAEDLYR